MATDQTFSAPDAEDLARLAAQRAVVERSLGTDPANLARYATAPAARSESARVLELEGVPAGKLGPVPLGGVRYRQGERRRPTKGTRG